MGKSDTLKDFVIFQTKHNYCNCKNLNPSKQCCLKAFKALDKKYKFLTFIFVLQHPMRLIYKGRIIIF
jgi:hypothetical protein